MKMQSLFGTLSILAAGAVVQGCSVQRYPVSAHAVAYNKAAADAQDRMLLLNVLRARDRKPMHFTTLTDISGSTKLTSGVSLSIPFSGPNPANHSATPSISVVTGPTYNVVVENKKKFLNGILSTLTLKDLHHFQAQGWPLDFLLHMFVSRVEVSLDEKIYSKLLVACKTKSGKKKIPACTQIEKNGTRQSSDKNRIKSSVFLSEFGKILIGSKLLAKGSNFSKYRCHDIIRKPNSISTNITYVNDPDYDNATKKLSFICFNTIANHVSDRRLLTVSTVSSTIRTGPPLTRREAVHPRALQAVLSNKAKLGCYMRKKIKDSQKYTYRKCENDEDKSRKARFFVTKSGSKYALKLAGSLKLACDNAKEMLPSEFTKGGDNVQETFGCGLINVSLTFRSVQGILYYMGEVVRAHLTKNRLVFLAGGKSSRKSLLEISRGPAAAVTGGVNVVYNGIPYAIRRSSRSRGLQTLALVNQLLGLKREADELNTPTRIRIQQ